MAGTWTSSEDEDFGSLGDLKVIVTAGTSGTPAAFSDFVTADRAGEGVLLAATAGLSPTLALDRAVRPVEILAIVVSLIVASKTAEADFVFVTGTDFDGVAQTESVDVTAGNGTYVTTKKWATISNVDCSDNSGGGGTAWADGTLRVTQAQWGLIWDKSNGVYIIDSVFDIGNGSTSTYLASENEFVRFNGVLVIKASATFRCGVENSGNTHDGTRMVHNWTSGGNTDWDGTVEWYDSYFESVANKPKIRFVSGATEKIQDFTFAGEFHISHGHDNSSGFLKRIRIAAAVQFTTYFSPNGATVDDIFWDGCFSGVEFAGVTPDNTIFNGFRSVNEGAGDPMAASFLTNKSLFSIDDEIETFTITWSSSSGSDVSQQYTCNINVRDKTGAALQSVTVLCEDQADAQVFSVSTDANGDIAQQTVTYKLHDSTPAVTTNSPHKFTLSKTGFHTLVMEQITLDHPIVWNLELQDQSLIPVRSSIGLLQR